MRVAFITTDLRDDHRRYSEPEPSFGAAPTALLEGFAQNSDCEVHVVSCVQKPVASPVRTFGNLFYHSVLVGKAGWLRGAYLGCILGVRRKLRQINPDIVHGQGTERYCALSAVFSGFPNVLTIHGNMRMVAKVNRAAPFTFEWLAARLESLALPKTAGVFCNSAYTEETVAPLAKKTWLVPNALRPAFFQPPLQAPRSILPLLLNLGTIIAYKNQIEILQVCRNLHARGLKFHVRFAGRIDTSTPYGAAFLSALGEAEKLGFASYAGFLEGAELIATLDTASALIHCPSEEAFGLVVAEGLARNLKFFGFRTGGVPDIAAGVSGAELFDADDWKALESSMERWLVEKAPKPTLANTMIEARYRPEVIARRHLEIYRDILAKSPLPTSSLPSSA